MSAAPSNTRTAHSSNNHRHRQPSRRICKHGPEPKGRKPTRRAKESDADEWFSIRDIVDEKSERGRTYYLVDWEGTDRNGQPYQPSWEPEVHVTEAAVRAWRDRRTATKARPGTVNEAYPPAQTSPQENGPAQASNLRRRIRGSNTSEHGDSARGLGCSEEAPRKRRRTDSPALDPDSAGPSPSAGRLGDSGVDKRAAPETKGPQGPQHTCITIELPHNPDLDRSAYVYVPPSQTGSQLSGSVYTDTTQRAGLRDEDHRVIPDSQELSAFSSFATTSETQASNPDHRWLAVAGRAQGEAIATRQDTQDQRAGPSFQSTAEIPSRQPDHGAPNRSASWPSSRFVLGTGPSSTQHNLVDNYPGSRDTSFEVRPRAGTNIESFDFATQESFPVDWNPPTSQPSSTRPISDEHIPATDLSQGQPSTVHKSTASQQTSSQAAQIVQPLSSQHSVLVAQSQADFTVYDDDLAVSHTTSRQPQVEHASQGSSQALSELDGNTRITPSAPSGRELVSQPERHRSATSDPLDSSPPVPEQPAAPTKMENTRPGTPMSARERVKLVREKNFARLDGQSPVDSPTPKDPVGTDLAGAQDDAPAASRTDVSEEAQVPVPSVSNVGPIASTTPAFARSPEAPPNERPSGEQQATEEPRHADASLDTPIQEQPATLNPSELTLSIEQDMDVSPCIPPDDALDPTPPVLDEFAPHEEEDIPPNYPKSLHPYVPTGPNEYVITLPLQSSSRPVYNDILRENEALIREFNASFLVYPYTTPLPSTVWKLDEVFTRLFDICDQPHFMETVRNMKPSEVAKHVTGTNAKLSFVAELLFCLAEEESDKKILILARPGDTMDFLGSIVETGGYRYFRSGLEVVSASAARNPLTVVLSSTVDKAASIPEDIDAVVAFDHTYRQDLLPLSVRERSPIVLALANTCTIQHLNMRVSENLEALERKNVLVLALVKAMRYVEDPDCTRSLPQIAELFSRHIQTPDDDDFYWESQSVPEDVFEDLHASNPETQLLQPRLSGLGTRQLPGSRKRSHDDEDDESVSKRVRMSQPLVVTNVSHISDSLKSLIADDHLSDSPRRTLSLSVSKLEALSTKITSLEAQLRESKQREKEFRELSDRAQKEVNGYSSSINSIQVKYMDALKDRGTYEAECTKIKEEARILAARLEASAKESEALNENNAELQRKLAEASKALLGSPNPELAKLAVLEKDFEEAKNKILQLEKKIAVTRSDMEYAQNAYQDASQKAVGLRAENIELEQKIEQLGRKADENIVKVNRIQSVNEVKELVRQLDEQKNLVRDRDMELSRLKEELRALKNGRRETRQSSVPRSPRLGALGVMSPRNGGRVKGGSSSRGTSPAPPTGIYDGPAGAPNPNSRFSHLRNAPFQ
ncbi:hypothetical protein GGS23DRAFT_547776 [Durotheca rogersii]|uniref:uncharacterized protein n=1 Tax=Durotheca rogersii TaxID=419775 RepID=UPI00221E5ADF|nr:uncharacterized protein GGS23DRAFT_547776 [Durotheca rogersii]KAI5867313.1 hypothetical protein GGS23DRAFT_547776 [Durotheca rogersii]